MCTCTVTACVSLHPCCSQGASACRVAEPAAGGLCAVAHRMSACRVHNWGHVHTWVHAHVHMAEVPSGVCSGLEVTKAQLHGLDFNASRQHATARHATRCAHVLCRLPSLHPGNFICWGLLLLVYQPWRKTTEVRPLKPNTDPINATQVGMACGALAPCVPAHCSYVCLCWL